MNSCLIIASNFPPIQSAGVYRTLRLVKYLPEHGWKLQVLTLSPDTLLEGTSTDPALLGQVPPGIGVSRAPARFRIEEFNRMTGRNKKSKQNKTPVASSQAATSTESKSKNSSPGLFQRFKDRVTMPWMTPDRLVGWVAPAVKTGMLAVTENAIDVIYSSGPPWSNHLVAGRIASATRLPWVADFRDPWVGNGFRPVRSGDTWAGRKHRALELDVYRKSSVVIFNTERARQDAVSRIGPFLADKSLVIPNGFDPSNFDELDSSQKQSDGDATGPLRMIHAGAFYGNRNIDSLLAMIGQLKRDGKLSANDLQLELIGRAREHEHRLVEQNAISDIVRLTPPVPHNECLQRLCGSDMLLLVQTEAPLCIPGKLYEYIAIGRPILTLSGEGATADLIATENLGLCIDPADNTQLKTGLLESIRQHRAGEATCLDTAIRDRYDGRQQMALFDAALRQALSVNPETGQSTGSTTT